MASDRIVRRSVADLVSSGEIRIAPFDEAKLRGSRYPLSAAVLFAVDGSGTSFTPRLMRKHEFTESDEYVFSGREYAVIEVREEVVLPDSMEARFEPVSDLVLSGFLLNVGVLDGGFGRLAGKRQRMLMGLKNLLDTPNKYSASMGLAHMFIGEASAGGSAFVTEQEVRRIVRRYAYESDAGPMYPQ